jgi:hypothetical protein
MLQADALGLDHIEHIDAPGAQFRQPAGRLIRQLLDRKLGALGIQRQQLKNRFNSSRGRKQHLELGLTEDQPIEYGSKFGDIIRPKMLFQIGEAPPSFVHHEPAGTPRVPVELEDKTSTLVKSPRFRLLEGGYDRLSVAFRNFEPD